MLGKNIGKMLKIALSPLTSYSLRRGYVFSARDYEGHQNDGAILHITEAVAAGTIFHDIDFQTSSRKIP